MHPDCHHANSSQFAHLSFFNSEQQHVVFSFSEDVVTDDSDDDFWDEPLIMHHTIPLGVASPARGQRPMENTVVRMNLVRHIMID